MEGVKFLPFRADAAGGGQLADDFPQFPATAADRELHHRQGVATDAAAAEALTGGVRLLYSFRLRRVQVFHNSLT